METEQPGQDRAEGEEKVLLPELASPDTMEVFHAPLLCTPSGRQGRTTLEVLLNNMHETLGQITYFATLWPDRRVRTPKSACLHLDSSFWRPNLVV